jgi:hypothetical protein
MNIVLSKKFSPEIIRYIGSYIEPEIVKKAEQHIAFSRDAAIQYISKWGNIWYVDETNYNRKYEVAVDEYNVPIRKSMTIEFQSFYLLLSRIRKKGKSRYYITKEHQHLESIGCDCGWDDCRNSSCTESIRCRDYRSLYVGNSFEEAVNRFVFLPTYYYTPRNRDKPSPYHFELKTAFNSDDESSVKKIEAPHFVICDSRYLG